MEHPVLAPDSFLDRMAIVVAAARASAAPLDLQAAQDFAGLCATPTYRAYSPREWIAATLGSAGEEWIEVSAEPTEDCAADLGLLERLLWIASRSIIRDEGSAIVLEVFQEEERRKWVPRIGLGLSGPGHVPEAFELAGRVRLSLPELSDCWTLVTRSGRIDPSPNGLDMRLRGERVTPLPLAEADEILKRLPDLDAALAYVEGVPRREAGDVRRLYGEVVEAYTPRLDRASIRCETLSSSLPLIIVDRGRLRRFFMAVFEYALWNVNRGGTVTWLIEYDAGARAISILVTVQGVGADPADFHTALMRRVIVDAHNGQFDCSHDQGETTIAVTLPDVAGAALDAWLPGWDCFGEQAQQMLRLLKSGGPAPPEDLILGGVLEQELTRWLMPRLALPLTQNVAGELQPKKAELPESHLDRLQKALQQIAKGKPKKEITAPAYAGELVYAFRGSERARGALETGALTDEELKSFAQALLASPPQALEALKLLARVVGKQ